MSSHTACPALQGSYFYWDHPASYFATGVPLLFSEHLFFLGGTRMSIFLIPSLLSPASVYQFALWPKRLHLVQFGPRDLGVSSPIGGTVSGPVSSIIPGPAYHPIPAWRGHKIHTVYPIPSSWGWPRPPNPPLSHPYGVLCSLSHSWNPSLYFSKSLGSLVSAIYYPLTDPLAILATSRASVSLQGPPFRMLPLMSTSQMASMKASANNAWITPFSLISRFGNANPANHHPISNVF